MHSEHSERGEPSDSELPLDASLISWHKMSLGKWQLNATLPTSQSSRKRERSLLLTNSAQRLQMRGYRRCAHNTPTTKHPHFPPIRCRSTQGFLGSHISTCLLSQEKSHCPTERHFPQPSCADQSRHMLSMFRLRRRARIDQLTEDPLALS